LLGSRFFQRTFLFDAPLLLHPAFRATRFSLTNTTKQMVGVLDVGVIRCFWWAPEYEFARRGGWSLRFGLEKKEPTVLPGDLLGAFYIQRLMMSPHKEIHVTALLGEIAGDDQLRIAMDGQEIIDQQARRHYMRRLEELAEDRHEAEQNDDESWLERIDRETDQITEELLKATGLGGKTRKMGDDVQNIRRRIAKTIQDVIEKIRDHDPNLAQHLKNTIHTNLHMCYRPDREIPWVFC